MIRITLINFYKLQEKSKAKNFSLFSLMGSFDGKDYISLTASLFNFGINLAIINNKYIPAKERKEVKLRVLDKK
jgi:hypothetical protein